VVGKEFKGFKKFKVPKVFKVFKDFKDSKDFKVKMRFCCLGIRHEKAFICKGGRTFPAKRK